MGDSDDIKGSALAKIRDNPLALVFIVGVLSGGSGSGIFNSLSPARPDPYTGTMGAAEQAARIAGDATIARAIEAERTERDREIERIHLRLQKAEARLDEFDRYRNDHRVESAQGFGRIEQLEKHQRQR